MISNSSPLIIFGKLNKIELLIKLFGRIKIAESVYDEVIKRGIDCDKEEVLLVEKHISKKEITIKKLDIWAQEKSSFLMKSFSKLDLGESDTIALALDEKEKYVLIDEKIARKVAELYGLMPIGVLGVLLLAYKKDFVNEEEIKKIIENLIFEKFRLGAEVINEFWKLFERMKKERKK